MLCGPHHLLTQDGSSSADAEFVALDEQEVERMHALLESRRQQQVTESAMEQDPLHSRPF